MSSFHLIGVQSRVEGNLSKGKPDTNPGPPGWGLCSRPATSPRKKNHAKNLDRGLPGLKFHIYFFAVEISIFIIFKILKLSYL